MQSPSRRQKSGAKKKILLLVESKGDGPWCQVHLCKAIEVRGADPETAIRICILNDKQDAMTYTIKGRDTKLVNIPNAKLKVERIKGNCPITVTAICGP